MVLVLELFMDVSSFLYIWLYYCEHITVFFFVPCHVDPALSLLTPFIWHFVVTSIITFLQAIDHIINSAAKTNYMSAGNISVPIVFRGPNGAAAGVGAQHSQVHRLILLLHFFVFSLPTVAKLTVCSNKHVVSRSSPLYNDHSFFGICAVLCSMVWLMPGFKSVGALLIGRCSRTAKSSNKGSWSCCLPWEWADVGDSV